MRRRRRTLRTHEVEPILDAARIAKRLGAVHVGKAAAKRRAGQETRAGAVEVISVSVDKKLLEVSDALARSLGITRAGLIERGLRAVLAANCLIDERGRVAKNIGGPNDVAADIMAGLREAAKLTPEQVWAQLIELGMIDEEGRVARNIGGRAKTKRPVSPRLLAR